MRQSGAWKIIISSILPSQEITREKEGLFVRACVLRARARVRVFVCKEGVVAQRFSWKPAVWWETSGSEHLH
jgi:hypothetical protein